MDNLLGLLIAVALASPPLLVASKIRHSAWPLADPPPQFQNGLVTVMLALAFPYVLVSAGAIFYDPGAALLVSLPLEMLALPFAFCAALYGVIKNRQTPLRKLAFVALWLVFGYVALFVLVLGTLEMH